MTAITYDTLKFVEKLTKSGIPENQAKAIVKAFSAAQHEAEFATKSDVKDLEIRLEHRLQNMEHRLIIKMGAMLALAVGLVVTLSKIL